LNEIALSEHLELKEGADQSIVKLSGGDMRKVLNILESCSLAHKTITSNIVYDVTGRPSESDVELLYNAVTMKRFNEALSEFM
jgi:replication factor C subunit 3/5